MRILVSAFLILTIYACSNNIEADLIIFGGNIYTVEETAPNIEAIAVKNDKIIAIGTFKEIEKYRGTETKSIDLKGKTLIPGFIESHAHLLGLGKQQRQLNLSAVKNYDELLSMVADAAKKTPKGEWIIGRGWHQSKWDPKPKLITGYQAHEKLSEISPEHPVMLIHASGHALFANAVAMKKAGIDPDHKLVSELQHSDDGEIICYPNGKATGIFTENAMEIIQAQVPKDSKESLYKDLQAAFDECLRNGICSFQDAGSDAAAIEIYREALKNNQFPIRLWAMLSYSNYAAEKVEEDDPFLLEWFKKGKEIGDYFSVGGVKLYADGALGSRGAWLLEDYSDRPGFKGNALLPLAIMEKIADNCLNAGFQLCTHAIGDKANREVLNVYERSLKKYPANAKDHRFRIEHAQHVHPEDIPRFKDLGVIASVQTIHFASDRPWAIDRLGKMRIEAGAYRWKQLIDSGAKVINGTDAPVEPINPLPSFYAAVTRKTLEGKAFETDQKMTRKEALQCYTLDAAYACFEDKVKGSIKVGKFADFTVLDLDIMTIPEEEILKTKVVMTIVGGKVYRIEN
jgi:predicted amidohydrolase YtcJ